MYDSLLTSPPACLIGMSHPTLPNLKILIPATLTSALPADFSISVSEDSFLVQFSSKNLGATLGYFTFSPTLYPVTLPSKYSRRSDIPHSFVLFILGHTVISCPLDYCNSTVAFKGGLFSAPDRGYLWMHRNFFIVLTWEGRFATGI